MDLICVKNLCFSYPAKKDTLKHINLSVKQGSFTCIVGENGSGKSTLLKCILGLNKGYLRRNNKKKPNRLFAAKKRNTGKLSCNNRRGGFVWNYF